MTTEPLAEFIIRRAALIESVTPGTAATRMLSDLTDEAVSALAEAAFASFREPWSLLALGAYGSRRLLPFSDLDLLVIVGTDPRSARDCVQALMYPLWDANFEVGHAVRTRKDHMRACAEDVETLTATLTGRYLAGDDALAAETLAAVAKYAGKKRSALLRAFSARPRPGSPYELEPDLKEGAGGQRDIDELTWRTAVALASPVARPGSGASGLLGDSELSDIAAAQDRISAARWLLHHSAGRKQAVLDFETAEAAPMAVEELHSALANIHELLSAIRGELPATDLHPRQWAPEELLGTLAHGTSMLPRLQCAARRSALETLAPGLAELMVLRRPALDHRFTVGAHSLMTAGLATELPATDPIAASVTSPDLRLALITACLTHDSGKTVPGPGHAERGQVAATQTALALGGSSYIAEKAASLVREHLLLAETASGADIDDEDVILRTAARIGDRDLVAPLYVLTAADSLATGPTTWDAWHASLVRTLVSRLDTALADDIDGAGMVERAEGIRSQALSTSYDEATAAVLRHVPVRFFAARSATEAAADARLLSRLGPRGSREQTSVRVSATDTTGAHRVAIAAYDRSGVFATLAGVIALSGLDILGATAFAGPAGTVLDTFSVVSATLAEIGPETWNALERRLAAAMDGHLDIRGRLAERRQQYPARAKGRTQIETRTESSFATALTVNSPDRVGLLFDIADEIAHAGFEITRVNALTRSGRASDTFHIVDTEGVAPRDPGELGHLSMRIRERLARL
ncbi:MAG: hypothetical protein CVT66_03600 [Actinobacteria bacterium HGW-Actinobacteria-6]|jgi:UTP:GlnB (protein PII) uridylyltransferase|nr:MAG: hypothetical protein CVT66_03600 [Actinobacteria bacterium HGW-Actinobacteria-6]